MHLLWVSSKISAAITCDQQQWNHGFRRMNKNSIRSTNWAINYITCINVRFPSELTFTCNALPFIQLLRRGVLSNKIQFNRSFLPVRQTRVTIPSQYRFQGLLLLPTIKMENSFTGCPATCRIKMKLQIVGTILCPYTGAAILEDDDFCTSFWAISLTT